MRLCTTGGAGFIGSNLSRLALAAGHEVVILDDLSTGYGNNINGIDVTFPGVGGHCIPVDTSYLSDRVKAKLGYAFRLVELAEEINHAAPDYVASRVWSLLNDHGKAVNGANVLLLIVTYKPNVSDCREGPADPIAVRLSSWGANLAYHDPFVPLWGPTGGLTNFMCAPDLDAALASADVVLLLQSHAQYDVDRLATVDSPLLDTRGAVPLARAVVRL